MKTASILLSLFAFILPACGGQPTTDTAANDAARPPTDTTAADNGPGGGVYPVEVRDNFLEGCLQQAPRESCECSLAYLEENLTVEEYTAAGTRLKQTGEPTEELRAASAECL